MRLGAIKNIGNRLSLSRCQRGYVDERFYAGVLWTRNWCATIRMSREEQRPRRSLDHAFESGDVV